MSAKAKNRSKEKRKRDKAARKAAEKAKYEGWKKAGLNSKSKRARKNEEKNQLVRTDRHLKGDCGNVGCRKCNANKGGSERRRRQTISFKVFAKRVCLDR